MRIRRSLRHWELAGFALVCAAGLLLRRLALPALPAPLSVLLPANGSVWEQMKALYLPYLLFTLAELPRFADPYRNFFAAKAVAGLAGLLTFPLLYYTARGALGPLPFWASAAAFCAAAAVSALSGCGLLNGFRLRGTAWQLAGFALLLAVAGLFAVFTLRPPALPLFSAAGVFP